jgi:hypothetical protein
MHLAHWRVKLSLYSTKHHAMKVYCGSECIAALDGGKWSAYCPGRFTPRERAPGTHWIGGWVGLRNVLDAVVKRKIPSPRRESNPRTPIVQPLAQRYTDRAISEEQRAYQKIKQEPVEQAWRIPSVILLTFMLKSAGFQFALSQTLSCP